MTYHLLVNGFAGRNKVICLKNGIANFFAEGRFGMPTTIAIGTGLLETHKDRPTVLFSARDGRKRVMPS